MMDPNSIYKAYKFAKKMSNNNGKDRAQKAERTIRAHVMWSMGAGFIPFPVADFLAVAAVQLDMIRSISNIYEVDFKETEGKALITSITGSGLSKVGANALIKLIPGIGSALGGASMSIMSAASTYALGQVFKQHFESGGNLMDFDSDRFKRYYNEQFEKGKKVAEDIRKEEKTKEEAPKAEEAAKEESVAEKARTVEVEVEVEAEKETPKTEDAPANDGNEVIVKKLKELAELKEMGVIDENEFREMKGRLIQNFYKG